MFFSPKGTTRNYVSGMLLAASTVLLFVGLPRFLHELMLIPGTPILYRVNEGKNVSAKDLIHLEDSRLEALKFIKHPKALSDLGIVYILRSRRAKGEQERLFYAKKAVETSLDALKSAPLNTFTWLRLATAYVVLGPDHYDKALKAWETSIETAKFEPFLLFQRVHLGIILYANMSSEEIALLKMQLKLAYQWNRGQLWQYAQNYNLFEWMIFLSEPGSEMVTYLNE